MMKSLFVLPLLLLSCVTAFATDALLGGMGTGTLLLSDSGKIEAAALASNNHRPMMTPAGTFAAIHVDASGTRTLRGLFVDEDSAYSLDRVEVHAAYPDVRMTYHDDELPVEVALHAWSPFVPRDLETSSMPATVWQYTVTNPGTEAVTVSLIQSWQNLAGKTGAGTNVSGEHRHQGVRGGSLYGIRMSFISDDTRPMVRSALGEMGVFAESERNDTVRMLPTWNPMEPDAFWSRLGNPSLLDEPGTSMERLDGTTANAPASALTLQREIAAGASTTFTFYVAWHIPEWIDADGTAHEKQYTEHYRDSFRTARLLADRRDDIRSRFDTWAEINLASAQNDEQRALLSQGMRWLAQTSFLLNDNRYAFLTSDPDFPGNFGSPEEYLLTAPLLLATFPEMIDPLLQPFARAQLPEGELPSSVGSLDSYWGRGDIPGGLLGRPDSSSAFALLATLYSQWAGDPEWTRRMSTNIRGALVWLNEQDSSGDFIPDGPSLFDTGNGDRFSFVSAELFASALRCGVAIGNTVGDMMFTSNSQQILSRVIDHITSQAWTGRTYIQPGEDQAYAAPLVGSTLFRYWGWSSALGEDQLPLHWQTMHTSAPLPYPDERLRNLTRQQWTDNATASNHPSPRVRALVDASAWWLHLRDQRTWFDSTNKCLILSAPSQTKNAQSSIIINTPMVQGAGEQTLSAVGGHSETRITITDSELKSDNRLQQVAFTFPTGREAENYTLRVFHNGEAIGGQDFVRESMRVFSFSSPRVIREDDTLMLVMSPNAGGRILIDPQTAEATLIGAQCEIIDIQPSQTMIRFEVVNRLYQSQIVFLEMVPDAMTSWMLYFNDEESAWPSTPGTLIPIVLQGGSLTSRESRWLQRVEFACEESIRILAEDMPGVTQRIHEELWDLQALIETATTLDRDARGFELTLQRSGEQPPTDDRRPESEARTIRGAFTRVEESITDIREDIRRLCPDPVLAAKILGTFSPLQVTLHTVEESFRDDTAQVRVTLESIAQNTLPLRMTITPQASEEITTDDALQRDLSPGEQATVTLTIRTERPLTLDRLEIPLQVSGVWEGSPIQIEKTLIVGQEPITQWSVLGPFPNPRGEGFAIAYPPESNISFDEIIEINERMYRWQDYSFDDGLVDFSRVLSPESNSVAYAYVAIQSPRDIPSLLHFGANGDTRVFLNFRERFAERHLSQLRPGARTLPFTLMPGWNYLVFKVSQSFGPWAFYAEITDRDGRTIPGLTYSSTQD